MSPNHLITKEGDKVIDCFHTCVHFFPGRFVDFVNRSISQLLDLLRPCSNRFWGLSTQPIISG